MWLVMFVFVALLSAGVAQAAINHRDKSLSAAPEKYYREPPCKHPMTTAMQVALDSHTPLDGTVVAWICQKCDHTWVEPRWLSDGDGQWWLTSGADEAAAADSAIYRAAIEFDTRYYCKDCGREDCEDCERELEQIQQWCRNVKHPPVTVNIWDF